MKRLLCCLLLVNIFSCCNTALSSADEAGVLKTRFTAVHYSDKKDIADFIWRLGGQKIELPADTETASSRIDRLVERVEAILDMQPKSFRIDIYLRRGLLESDRVAFYDRKTRSIYISVDHTSDGVLAHEIAHAVIDRYFSSPLPAKVGEILTQYVDKYLWSDY